PELSSRSVLMDVSRLVIVDLGSLNFAAVIDVNGFPFAERIDRRLSCLAMAVSGPARAAERKLNLGPRGAGVDVNDACRDVAHGAIRLVHVLREDRRGEAES